MTPQVSVVIPTYNRAEKVRKTIESVFAQSIQNLEVIVVDDGSSDDTAQVLDVAFGDRIHYIFQPNQGVSVARNKGIDAARGEWIAFLDSDDLWERHKLEWQLKALDRLGPECRACYTDVRFYNHSEVQTMFQLAEANYRHEKEIGINEEVLRLLVRPGGSGMVVCLSSFLAHRDVLKKVGRFEPAILYSQDSEYMFRVAMHTRFCYVNRPLVLFDRSPVEERHVGVSSEWNKSEFFLKDSQIRLEGLLPLAKSHSPAIWNLVRRQLGSVYSGWVNHYLSSGQPKKARYAAFRAARFNPTVNLIAKLLMTWASPSLALRAVRGRELKRSSEFTV